MAVVAAETCWSLDDYKSQRRLFPLYNINFFFSLIQLGKPKKFA